MKEFDLAGRCVTFCQMLYLGRVTSPDLVCVVRNPEQRAAATAYNNLTVSGSESGDRSHFPAPFVAFWANLNRCREQLCSLNPAGRLLASENFLL